MHIRQVHPEEENLVADVLSCAATSLAKKGNALWGAAEVDEAAVKEHVRAGMYYVAFDDEGPVGVFRFQLEDRLFWPEILDGSSTYVHKIAVYPHKQGSNVAHILPLRMRSHAATWPSISSIGLHWRKTEAPGYI